eukprot:TRINITY_DN5762_c0_g1_i1.p1 TRINITY_DN5762_c0_g1~~TRINITY_DN5762_c0_g1_i1.p1  ORF type:complete len:312 (+),score=56.90 TRINITY_DN5762_c0_g1_i1:99-1034(+)
MHSQDASVSHEYYGAVAQNFENINGYSGSKSAFGRPQRRAVNLASLAVCLFLPWLIFTVVYSVSSLSIHYTNPASVLLVEVLAGAVLLLLGQSAFQNLRQDYGQPSWYVFLFLTSALALTAAAFFGDSNYKTNMVPLMDIQNMNSYDVVDPSQSKGNQLMDAGRVHFTPEAKLDIAHSLGFKNLDTYCVAPITSTDKPGNYDFWAVGLNCCSGHMPDFHCGEYNNPSAHSGLRLMRDDLRSYFRLAVQQAEAAYNIQANHPVFFYWMQDPQTEVSAYENAAYTNWMVGVFVALGVQLVLVVVATIIFAKLG